MEGFIPVFEEKQEKNLLVQIDDFQDKIVLIDKLTKEYDEIKKKLKEQMVTIGKENELTQVKWTTPKGIQITCSIGKKPIFEEQEYEEFDMETFKKENPDIFKKYIVTKTKQVAIQNATYDRLVVTMPKDK